MHALVLQQLLERDHQLLMMFGHRFTEHESSFNCRDILSFCKHTQILVAHDLSQYHPILPMKVKVKKLVRSGMKRTLCSSKVPFASLEIFCAPKEKGNCFTIFRKHVINGGFKGKKEIDWFVIFYLKCEDKHHGNKKIPEKMSLLYKKLLGNT